jgi:hypothetical protein
MTCGGGGGRGGWGDGGGTTTTSDLKKMTWHDVGSNRRGRRMLSASGIVRMLRWGTGLCVDATWTVVSSMSRGGCPSPGGEEWQRRHVVHAFDPVNSLVDEGGADNDVRRRRRQGGMGRRWGHDNNCRPENNDMARCWVQLSWEEDVVHVGHCPRVVVGDGIMH